MTTEIATKRDISEVTLEIKMIHNQAQRLILDYAIEIGRRLAEAKSILPHGSWGSWLKDEVEFSQDTAGRLMRLFEEYGDRQLSMFGTEANSAALRNLTYTKALQLLAVPAEEREEFVEAHNVENLSTRELDKLIKERDEANKAREEAERLATQRGAELEAEKTERRRAEDQVRELESRPVEVAVQEPDEATVKKAVAEELRKSKEKFEADKKKLQEKLDAAEKKRETLANDLKATQDKLSSAGSESSKLEKDYEASLERAKADMEQQITALKKQIAMADTGVTAFKTLFQESQTMLGRLLEYLKAVEDPDAKERLRTGTSKMLQLFTDRLSEV